MIVEMQTSVCGTPFCFNQGEQYEMDASRAEEFVRLGWAVPVPIAPLNAARMEPARPFKVSRGPRREAR